MPDLNQGIMDTAITAVGAKASKVTFAGSAGAVVGAISSSNIGMWVGILTALIGLWINYYYKRQENTRQKAREERERLEWEARMRKLNRDSSPVPLSGAFGDE